MLLFQQNLQTNGQSLTLTASAGSFTESGQDAQIKVGRTLNAEQSSFTLNGQSVNLTAHRSLVGDYGQFTLSGQDSQINANRTALVEYGQFALSGQNVTISKDGAIGYSILAEFGQVTLSGQSVQITKTAKPTGGAVKRPKPVFTPRDYREQILKEDEMILMFINEIMINIK